MGYNVLTFAAAVNRLSYQVVGDVPVGEPTYHKGVRFLLQHVNLGVSSVPAYDIILTRAKQKLVAEHRHES